jgi:hypothetical protein
LVTDQQVKLYRKKRMEAKKQEQAAAVAGMSVRTARTWETGPLPSQTKEDRTWRTRADPFADVWDDEVVPLLRSDDDRKLQAKTVLKALRNGHPGEYPRSLTRTMQRRIRDWRALNGPPQEVVFPQEHPMGREAAFDFTHCGELGVTIAGETFDHLLFTLKSSAGKWVYTELAYGETWEAMSRGLQDAMAAAGGVFPVWRHDNLSAATKELKKTGGRQLTRRYQELLDHYGATSSRIQAGKASENGVAEKGNHLLKSALDQALRLCENRDFPTREAYLDFVRKVVAEHNAEHAAAIEAERVVLKPLPDTRLPDYTSLRTTVRAWSTIRVAGRTYSVPSRLIGHEVEVRQHPDLIEVRLNDKTTIELPRLRGKQDVRIDYRHVIWSLVRKPGAFARYRFREELFPSMTFRRAYDALVDARGERADIEYVRILHLAASTMEAPVERALEDLLVAGKTLDYAAVKALAAPEPVAVPEVSIGKVDLAQFDRMLGGSR